MSETAFHGGAFFEAIGVDLRHLERASEIVSADVLDAWFDPSPRILELLGAHLPFLLKTSPPNHAEGFVAEIAARRGVPESSIVTGSGSSALLFACLPRLLDNGCSALLLDPMYSEYEHLVEDLLQGTVHRHTLKAHQGFALDAQALLEDVERHRPDAVLLVNPNNPTGRLWPRAEAIRFLDQLPARTLVVVDEAYLDYAGAENSLETEAAARPNLIVIKSMSKVYSLSGARVAYLVAHPVTAARLRRWMPPWPVGLLAQAAAMEALRDPAYYAACYQQTHRLREALQTALTELHPYPSDTNFFLIRPEEPAALAARLRAQGIFVREFPSGALANRFLRLTVKDEATNARLAAALLEA